MAIDLEWLRENFYLPREEEEIPFAQRYPELLDTTFVWGKCPQCGRELTSGDMKTYRNIIHFMYSYDINYSYACEHGMGNCRVTCDGHTGGVYLSSLVDYCGPEYSRMPEEQKINASHNNRYFVV